jgi:hypothetical protein
MWLLGPIGFAAPLALIALGVLPILWWVLRVTPPMPKVIAFPGIRLLRDLVHPEETSAKTPLWLILFRLALAACLIVALAEPIWKPQATAPAGSTLLVVVDNDWAAGANWPARQGALSQLLDRADHAGQQVAVLATATTAEGSAPAVIGPERAATLRGPVEALRPQPWPVDRQAALAALQKADLPGTIEAVWLADGIDSPGATELGTYLAGLADARLIVPEQPPHLLAPPVIDKQGLTATVLRPEGHTETVTITATRSDGSSLGTATASFKDGETKATALFSIPTELANDIDRLAITGEPDAGTTFLLDQRWRRRPIGLVGMGSDSNTVLSGSPYLKAALEPFGEVRTGTVETLLKRPLSTLILDDPAAISEDEQKALKDWMDKGGVLIRFAGPHLVATDPLLPVKLRAMDRSLGGALSWEKPAQLAPFPPGSPFAGLILPDDITVNRQVLAEPSLDLTGKVWASLTDGTPLVTAAPEGKGWLVLVHTTAGPDWSNLSLSGGFIEFMRRLSQLGGGVGNETPLKTDKASMLAPLSTLDGFGVLGDPPPTALPVPAADFESALPAPAHPPGYYGSKTLRRSLNLGQSIAVLAPLRDNGLYRGAYNAPVERSLKPALLAIAALALALDTLIGLWLKGLLRRRARGAALAAVLACCLLSPAHASQDVEAAATHTTLGFVITGNSSVDQMSAAGLSALAQVVVDRSSVEEAATQAVNIETDDLAVYPLLYWPVREGAAQPSAAAIARINAYLGSGGMILFDTADGQFGGGADPGQEALGHLAAKLDIPALEQVPAGHTLGKSFYLLSTFPGRYADGPVWVEKHGPNRNDNVSSVIIGGNDWAAAWAVDENGQPLVPVPDRQRELAYRFGVNVVMYALTGNYKSDQVFTPYILQRLGQ